MLIDVHDRRGDVPVVYDQQFELQRKKNEKKQNIYSSVLISQCLQHAAWSGPAVVIKVFIQRAHAQW